VLEPGGHRPDRLGGTNQGGWGAAREATRAVIDADRARPSVAAALKPVAAGAVPDPMAWSRDWRAATSGTRGASAVATAARGPTRDSPSRRPATCCWMRVACWAARTMAAEASGADARRARSEATALMLASTRCRPVAAGWCPRQRRRASPACCQLGDGPSSSASNRVAWSLRPPATSYSRPVRWFIAPARVAASTTAGGAPGWEARSRSWSRRSTTRLPAARMFLS
jgi:hypothetical protein